MEFITEINTAIKSGLDEFKQFIDNKLQKNEHYLKQYFWMEEGAQLTVLNYLLQQHQEQKTGEQLCLDLTLFIDYILNKVGDKNFGEPLHQVLALGKVQLATHMLEQHTFDVDRRDEHGRTLLSLVLATKNRLLFSKILTFKPQVNAITQSTEKRIPFQPLHEAIMLDSAYVLTELVKAGAALANPVGPLKETPVLLAARLGKIKALHALLEFPVEELNLGAENHNLVAEQKMGDNAVESLCNLLAKESNNKDLIRGLAMLLCRGAEPPRNEVLCQLLANKRHELLQAIDNYLQKRPNLADSFVTRCHATESALHQIIYVDHSWGSAFRWLFGKPSEVAYIIENFVTRKITPKAAPVPLTEEDPPLKLYAEFVRRYNQAYQQQKITNPWSTMRWMIASGKCNWKTIQQYAQSHPGTRTQIIYEEMVQSMPKNETSEKIALTATPS